MSMRPSSISTNVRRYESGLKSPKPPGAVVSPVKARRMSVMSAEIEKLSPNSAAAYQLPKMPDELQEDEEAYSGASSSASSSNTTSQQSSPSRPLSSGRRSAAATESPKRSATTGLKSLGGSSYDLNSFYASFNADAPKSVPQEAAGANSSSSPLFTKSPNSPTIGSPVQAAAERSGRRRSPRRGRKRFNAEGKVLDAEDESQLKSKGSKLQLLDDLLAQVQSTNEMFHKQLGDAKKDAKRIVKRSERDGRRLTYTKTQLDDAIHGAEGTVAVFKALASRHTLGSLPERDRSGRFVSLPKIRWKRALRKISFKHAVERTSLDLLARSEKAANAKARSRAPSRQDAVKSPRPRTSSKEHTQGSPRARASTSEFLSANP
eukprot:INCI8196.1.p1 GENE.INCI8196.1~~INCI8196.1.p1  ORF type:complete len:377 (-),score=58.72 INCI8196.1:1777-2907(-)